MGRRDRQPEAVAVGEGLLDVLAEVPDPRDPRGRRHWLVSLLAIAIVAVEAGARSWVTIGEVASDLDPSQLARLGVWPSPYTGRYTPPAETTIRRALQRLDPHALERLLGGWFQTRTAPDADPSAGQPSPRSSPAAEDTAAGGSPAPSGPPAPTPPMDAAGADRPVVAVAVDGKTLRGSTVDDSRPVHLLAALDHDTGTVLAQRRVEAKRNEISGFRPLLEQVDLTGRVITADAMHCQRAHARWLVEQQGAEDLFIAKDNQPHLVETISRVPEQAFSPPDTTVDRGHGRVGCRTVRAAPAGDGVDFPGVRQVMEILRHTTDLDGSNPTTVEYGVTSLDAARADPARLGVLAPGHWSIEALHHVRDVTFAEDASRVRTGNGPQVRAALHNTGIGLLRLAGYTNIAAATRRMNRNTERALVLLGV